MGVFWVFGGSSGVDEFCRVCSGEPIERVNSVCVGCGEGVLPPDVFCVIRWAFLVFPGLRCAEGLLLFLAVVDSGLDWDALSCCFYVVGDGDGDGGDGGFRCWWR